MNTEFFYDTDGVSLSDRESFNNTIILLTLVKKDHYYMTGFSRPNGIIEIGFDYESDIHRSITEHITIDFAGAENCFAVKSELSNISPAAENGEYTAKYKSRNFKALKKSIFYEHRIPKDDIIPISMLKMHRNILFAKDEISRFLEGYYKYCMQNK